MNVELSNYYDSLYIQNKKNLIENDFLPELFYFISEFDIILMKISKSMKANVEDIYLIDFQDKYKIIYGFDKFNRFYICFKILCIENQVENYIILKIYQTYQNDFEHFTFQESFLNIKNFSLLNMYYISEISQLLKILFSSELCKVDNKFYLF